VFVNRRAAVRYRALVLLKKKEEFIGPRSHKFENHWSRTSTQRWRWSCQPYAPTGRPLSAGRFLVLISVRGLVTPQGYSADGRIRSIEKSSDLIGNRIRDLPACTSTSTNYATACPKQRVRIVEPFYEAPASLVHLCREELSTLLRWEEAPYSLHALTDVCQKLLAGYEYEVPLPEQGLSRFQSNTVISTSVEKL
jgi:hypothetical protein